MRWVMVECPFCLDHTFVWCDAKVEKYSYPCRKCRLIQILKLSSPLEYEPSDMVSEMRPSTVDRWNRREDE